MACIDKNLTQDQIEDRIEKYVLDRMTEEERGQFEEHFAECEFCEEEADSGQRIARIIERKITFEDMLAAQDAKDYKRVIELGQKMRELGYREELYPINDKVFRAYLQNSEFKLVLDDHVLEYEIVSLKSGKLTLLANIAKAGLLEIKSVLGSIKRQLTDKDIFVKGKDLSHAIAFEEDEPLVDVEEDEKQLKVYPGHDKARIVISLNIDAYR